MSDLELIAWRCEVCREQIADGGGGIYVDIVAADRVRRDRVTWDAEVRPTATITDYLKRPKSVDWHAVHARCHPEPDTASYLIEIDDLRSPWDILSMTSYLMGKPWLDGTNWSILIGGLARDHVKKPPTG